MGTDLGISYKDARANLVTVADKQSQQVITEVIADAFPGHAIVGELLARARVLGVRRVFCLTFAVDFFTRHGFQPISGTPVAAEVYSELLRSYDEGVAEFLDLERVKPNTLGNTRMLLRLLPER